MSDVENKSHTVMDRINNGRPCRSSVDAESCCNTEQMCFEIVEVLENHRESSVPEGRGDVDSVSNVNVHLDMVKRNCRICSLSIDMTNDNTESDTTTPTELGCSCKNDLGTAHKHCAEHWFRIKGNKICEICGSIARNVASPLEIELAERLLNDTHNGVSVVQPTRPSLPVGETNFRLAFRFVTIFLICMVCSVVFTWLLHFYMPS